MLVLNLYGESILALLQRLFVFQLGRCRYSIDRYSLFLVGIFEENARLLQWLVFRQFNAIGPLFCSFVQHHQRGPRTSKTYSKCQNLVQNKSSTSRTSKT